MSKYNLISRKYKYQDLFEVIEDIYHADDLDHINKMQSHRDIFEKTFQTLWIIT